MAKNLKNKVKVVCAYCKKTIEAGNKKGRVSHGMHLVCLGRFHGKKFLKGVMAMKRRDNTLLYRVKYDKNGKRIMKKPVKAKDLI